MKISVLILIFIIGVAFVEAMREKMYFEARSEDDCKTTTDPDNVMTKPKKACVDMNVGYYWVN